METRPSVDLGTEGTLGIDSRSSSVAGGPSLLATPCVAPGVVGDKVLTAPDDGMVGAGVLGVPAPTP